MRKYLFTVLVLIGLVPLLLGALGRFSWILDLFSHFRLYYFMYFIFIGMIAIVSKKKREAVISIGIALILAFGLIKFHFPAINSDAQSKQTIRIASINLLSSNKEYKQVIAFIKEGNYDVILIQELNSAWKYQIDKLEGYSNQLLVPREDNFGIGVLSRIEVTSFENIDLSDVGIPSILMNFEFDGDTLQVLGTHPLPPIGSRYFKSRNYQFESINSFINKTDGELILIGDFNSTVFSPNFKRLLQNGRLKDSRIGNGLLPTWNALWGKSLITLDHIFVTNGIQVVERSTGETIGSDHLPVAIEIAIK